MAGAITVLAPLAKAGPARPAERARASSRVARAEVRPELLPTAAAVERIVLPSLRGNLRLEVDPLGQTISLLAPRDLGGLAARISKNVGTVCPRWEVEDSRLVLYCRTPRLHAEVSSQGGKRYLDIQQLRGLPREGPDQRLDIFYDPPLANLGEKCPGSTDAGRAECAVQAGDLPMARVYLEKALVSSDRSVAALRLGDLAAAEHDWSKAAMWWKRAGSFGPFGRLAVARLCELSGDCFGDKRSVQIFEAGVIAEPMRTELLLRLVRVDAFSGRSGDVLRRISQILERSRESGGCVTLGRRFCRRILLWALKQQAEDGGMTAIETYLNLPGRTEGVYAMEMAHAAGEKAAGLGAPIFAGNLLASVAAEVPITRMSEHLALTAEYYYRGKDIPRGQLVLEYADTRLTAKERKNPRWAGLFRDYERLRAVGNDGGLKARITHELLMAESARDLAEATSALARLKAELP